MNKEKFVENIKKICALRGVAPTVACRESGAGKDLINQIEVRGSIPSVEKVSLLAAYLGVTTSELLGEVGPGDTERPTPVPGDGPEDEELIRLWKSLSPADVQRVKDFAQGLIAARGAGTSRPE